MLAPFRGVRFAPDRVRDLGAVTSPPYDLVDEETVAGLMAADPHNVVRLIQPRERMPPRGGRERPVPDGRYAHAGETLRRWLAEGVLVTDPAPALYVYEQAGAATLQRGLLGAVGLAGETALRGGPYGPARSGSAPSGPAPDGRTPDGRAPDGTAPAGARAARTGPGGTASRRAVLPHEDVFPWPIRDRLRLMRATGANLEPIFLLYEGDGPASDLVDEVASGGRPPDVATTTDDGLTHRLWRVADPGRHALVAADLRDRQALIADGHHRYATYQELRAEQPGPGPWDYGLALLVDSRRYPPRLGAIHRVIPGLAVTEAARQAATAFRVRQAPGELRAALDLLAAGGRDGNAFLLAGDGPAVLVTEPDPVQVERAMPAERSPRWRRLDTSVLHELLIRRVWGLDDGERTVRIVHHDPYAAVARARHHAGTAVIVNPLDATTVLAVAAGGERVPRKSTSFGPKPRTGLVLRTFAAG